MNLEGKVALVTGGAVRIGRSLSLALSGRGVRLAVHYGHSREAAGETVSLIHKIGSDAAAFQADLKDTTASMALVGQTLDRFGRIDILVNNAAVFMPGGADDTTEENWDTHFNINLKTPFFLANAFARNVDRSQTGLIVNISDWRAFRPGPDYLAYTMTKAGIVTMTQSLAQTLAPHIRVNAIAPGAILPPPGRNGTFLTKLGEKLPLRRTGSPADVSRALIYLAEADFVTGEILFVDGGEHL